MPIYDQSCSLSDTSYENNFDTKKNVFWVKGVESWEIRIPAITPHGSIKVTSVFTFQLLFRASLKVKIAEIPPKLVYLRQKISPVFSVLQIVTKNNHSNFGVPSHEQFRKVSKAKCFGSLWNHPGHKPVGVRGARDLHDITVPTRWANLVWRDSSNAPTSQKYPIFWRLKRATSWVVQLDSTRWTKLSTDQKAPKYLLQSRIKGCCPHSYFRLLPWRSRQHQRSPSWPT